jgi:hypothetical protein
LNKRDVSEAVPEVLLRTDLGCNGAPYFSSVADQGVGVFDTLKAIIKLVVANTRGQMVRVT